MVEPELVLAGFESVFDGPALGQVKSSIDKSMAGSRHITGKHADLAVRNLAC